MINRIASLVFTGLFFTSLEAAQAPANSPAVIDEVKAAQLKAEKARATQERLVAISPRGLRVVPRAYRITAEVQAYIEAIKKRPWYSFDSEEAIVALGFHSTNNKRTATAQNLIPQPNPEPILPEQPFSITTVVYATISWLFSSKEKVPASAKASSQPLAKRKFAAEYSVRKAPQICLIARESSYKKKPPVIVAQLANKVNPITQPPQEFKPQPLTLTVAARAASSTDTKVPPTPQTGSIRLGARKLAATRK